MRVFSIISLNEAITNKNSSPIPRRYGPPVIWHTFKAKDTDSDKMVEYHIRNLPKWRNNEAVDLMVHYYLKEEPLSVVHSMYLFE